MNDLSCATVPHVADVNENRANFVRLRGRRNRKIKMNTTIKFECGACYFVCFIEIYSSSSKKVVMKKLPSYSR